MADLGELLIKIGVDDEDAKRGIQEVDDQASSAGGSIGSKLGGAFKTVGKVAMAGMAAATAAVGAITKSAVQGYSDYQQLSGGVSKLYGTGGKSIEEYAESVGKSVDDVREEYGNLEKATDDVMKNAANAYKTSGMSANQYMETATQFSASLISSLGGDTQKAADQTDVAMKAISDNVNTFGSNMDDVTNAFKGFSKQNYAMLDNLKLGFGGTKSEMERLIKEANEWGAANGKASDLSIDSFSDVVTAIEQIQEKQGIAGTTAREAMTTLEGSMNMTKNAWQDLVDSLANPDADIGEKIDNLITSLTGDADIENSGLIAQLVPTIERALEGVATLLDKAIPQLMEHVPDLLNSTLPTLLSAATSLVTQIASALPGLVTLILDQVPTVLEQLISGITDIIPDLITALFQAEAEFYSAIGEMLPELIPQFVQMIMDTIQSIVENVGDRISGEMSMEQGLVQGIENAIPVLLSALPDVLTAIVDFFTNSVPQIVQAGVTLLTGLIQDLPTIISQILSALPQIITSIIQVFASSVSTIAQAGVQLLTSIVQNLPAIIAAIVQALPQIISAIVSGLISAAPQLLEAGITLFGALATAIPEAIVTIVASVPQIITAIVSGLKDGMSQIKAVGGNLIKGLWEGISDKVGWIKDKIKGFGSSVISSIKGIFGVHSPSRVFAGIGKNLTLGLGMGIMDDQAMGKVYSAVHDLEVAASPTITSTVQTSGNLFANMKNALPPIQIDATTVVDGKVLRQTSSDYTINQIMADKKAHSMAMGGA